MSPPYTIRLSGEADVRAFIERVCDDSQRKLISDLVARGVDPDDIDLLVQQGRDMRETHIDEAVVQYRAARAQLIAERDKKSGADAG